MGFDNIFISSVLSPALTTVKQPLFNLGVEAVNNLIDLVSGDKKGVQKVNLNTEIIERDTVSAPLC